MEWILVIFLFAVAVALAIFEIQIEGPNGWAEKLPCWRARPNSCQQKIYGALMGGKPCDGFHLSELVLLLLLFHIPFVWSAKWSAGEEFKLLAYFFAVATSWDFLWFILNPAYGWKKFSKKYIWWHKHWLGLFPKDYYNGLINIGIFIVLASWFSNNFLNCLTQIIINLGGIIGLTILMTLTAELTRTIGGKSG